MTEEENSTKQAYSLARSFRASHMTLKQTAEALNEANITTITGKRWTDVAVCNLLKKQNK